MHVEARRACREGWGADCGTCEARAGCGHAPLAPPDEDIARTWRIWCICRTQMRYSFGGVAGLDYPAAIQAAKIYGFRLDCYDMEGLRILEADMLAEQAEERRREDLERKARQGGNSIGQASHI